MTKRSFRLSSDKSNKSRVQIISKLGHLDGLFLIEFLAPIHLYVFSGFENDEQDYLFCFQAGILTM